MSALSPLLDSFRTAAVTEREKGTCFEDLTLAYLRTEPTYRDLYSDVWTYAEWAIPLALFMRVITVSLETTKLVNGLPALDIGL